MTIHYRSARQSDVDTIRELLAATGWSKRVADIERFETLLANSDRTVVAIDDERLVGFARALCDEVSNGYISMVVVKESHRRLGIGRELILRLVGDDPRITWVLRAGRSSAPFWESVGFTPSQLAMERTRIRD